MVGYHDLIWFGCRRVHNLNCLHVYTQSQYPKVGLGKRFLNSGGKKLSTLHSYLNLSLSPFSSNRFHRVCS